MQDVPTSYNTPQSSCYYGVSTGNPNFLINELNWWGWWLSNPNASINVTFEGASPVETNLYYNEFFTTMQILLDAAEADTAQIQAVLDQLILDLDAAIANNEALEADLSELQALYDELNIQYNFTLEELEALQAGHLHPLS